MADPVFQIFCTNDSFRGPGKVVKNLQRGLRLLGVRHETNTPPRKETHILCLQPHPILTTDFVNSNAIIGPNICVLPFEHPTVMQQKYKLFLVPSEWVKKLWSRWLPENKIAIWPVGIDTDAFSPASPKENDCLLYVKHRSTQDVNQVKDLLMAKKQTVVEFFYGQYTEADFLLQLNRSKYAIVIAGPESQGIAIQEIMSCDLPLLVWDVQTWNSGTGHVAEATSVPYWSGTCGLKVFETHQVEPALTDFLRRLGSFRPRSFILQNLNLKKQAKALVDLFSKRGGDGCFGDHSHLQSI